MTETAETIKDTVETLAPYLDKPADNIGNNGTYVFGLMVKQVYIIGITDILFFVITFILGYTGVRLLNSPDLDEESQENTKAQLGGIVCIIAIVSFVIDCLMLQECITCLANPEYQAIIQLLHAIK